MFNFSLQGMAVRSWPLLLHLLLADGAPTRHKGSRRPSLVPSLPPCTGQRIYPENRAECDTADRACIIGSPDLVAEFGILLDEAPVYEAEFLSDGRCG